jgi:hypothetical protein
MIYKTYISYNAAALIYYCLHLPTIHPLRLIYISVGSYLQEVAEEGKPKAKRKRKSARATKFYYRGREMEETQVSGMISASMWCPKALFFVDKYTAEINATIAAVEEYYRRRVMVIALPPAQTMYQLTFGPNFQVGEVMRLWMRWCVLRQCQELALLERPVIDQMHPLTKCTH